MKVFDQIKTDNCKNSKNREEKVNSVRSFRDRGSKVYK